MYGHPTDREFANQALQLWGVRQRYGGPEGYPHEANFIPKARGMPVEWQSNIAEIVAFVVVHCLTADERRLVKMYYEPHPDELHDGESIRCNTSAVLRRCKREQIRVNGRKVNKPVFDSVIDCAIGKVAMALAYPPSPPEPPENEESEKNVCNF